MESTKKGIFKHAVYSISKLHHFYVHFENCRLKNHKFSIVYTVEQKYLQIRSNLPSQ